mmetsp:Transcript_165/g.265  ORF Transcript_165/g.265 Transcript_165/m.265 type:complete len:249 (+) Transcript_165:41-787(+)
MRFRFCGDLDAPDWLLAEITTLSKIPAVQFRLLLKQVVQFILSGSIDYDEVAKVVQDSALEEGHSDTKGAVSALHFALSNSAKYDVEDTTLLLEIQQLGLPKDNADAVAGAFREAKDEMRKMFSDRAYRVNAVKDVAWRVDTVLGASSGNPAGSLADGRAAETPVPLSGSPGVAGSSVGVSKEVHLKFTVDSAPHARNSVHGDNGEYAAEVAHGRGVEEVAVLMTADKFSLLHLELKKAKATLAALHA